MTKPRILYVDIETIPNLGYFFDMFSDRGIPLQFVTKPKSIVTISWKFGGDKKAKVLSVDTPYDDYLILKEFSKVYEEADYVIGHFIEGFDIPFISARLMANGLPPLATVPSIDTYKLAKKHFGRTLNSNRLDHLGEILKVGRKNKTDVTLWVRCAENNKKALKEMAAYNIQDVELLEKVALKLLPYTSSKLNMNLFSEAELVCSNCGSEKVQKRGTIVTRTVKKIRLQCQDCGCWSQTKYEKEATKKKKSHSPSSDDAPW